MAAVDYPATLPAPNQAKYALQPVDPVIRTQMDSGSPRNRRRFTTYPTRIPVEWLFTEAEMATFESWFDNTVNSGESWFNVNLINGLSVSSYEARFYGSNGNPWKASMQPGNSYVVSAILEVKSRPILDATYLAVLTAYDPNDIVYAAPVFDTLLNTTIVGNYW